MFLKVEVIQYMNRVNNSLAGYDSIDSLEKDTTNFDCSKCCEIIISSASRKDVVVFSDRKWNLLRMDMLSLSESLVKTQMKDSNLAQVRPLILSLLCGCVALNTNLIDGHLVIYKRVFYC